MITLGIETSCDETAASVVIDGAQDGGRRLLSNVVASSMGWHARYGGVIPENAARSHIEVIIPTIKQALRDADVTFDDIDAIAVTRGAGLSGSLLMGVMTARTLSITENKPLYGVNHVEAHLYVNFITESALPDYDVPGAPPQFPILGIIVSGGHSQLVLFHNHFDYILLGQTYDDAIGEAFDKVAKLLGMPYPGGVQVSELAKSGNPQAFKLPKARLQGRYDFSYSGLKTAVLRLGQELVGKDHTLPSFELPKLLSQTQKADIAASFQRIAVETIVDKAVRACEEFQPASVIIGGGVAANTELRRQLDERLPLPIAYPDRKLCTDNGAMIATLGSFRHQLGAQPDDPYTLNIAPNLSM